MGWLTLLCMHVTRGRPLTYLLKVHVYGAVLLVSFRTHCDSSWFGAGILVRNSSPAKSPSDECRNNLSAIKAQIYIYICLDTCNRKDWKRRTSADSPLVLPRRPRRSKGLSWYSRTYSSTIANCSRSADIRYSLRVYSWPNAKRTAKNSSLPTEHCELAGLIVNTLSADKTFLRLF